MPWESSVGDTGRGGLALPAHILLDEEGTDQCPLARRRATLELIGSAALRRRLGQSLSAAAACQVKQTTLQDFGSRLGPVSQVPKWRLRAVIGFTFLAGMSWHTLPLDSCCWVLLASSARPWNTCACALIKSTILYANCALPIRCCHNHFSLFCNLFM